MRLKFTLCCCSVDACISQNLVRQCAANFFPTRCKLDKYPYLVYTREQTFNLNFKFQGYNAYLFSLLEPFLFKSNKDKQISLLLFIQKWLALQTFESPNTLREKNVLNRLNLIHGSAYKTFFCRLWNNTLNSIIYFIWLTTRSIKFSVIELNKILFEPANRICLVTRLNNPSHDKMK